MKKILFVATMQSHVGQFHNPTIKALKEKGYEIHVAAKNNLKEKDTLTLSQVDMVFDLPFARSPLSLTNFKAYKMLKKIINEGEYDIVYCHTPVGGVLSRLACRKLRKKGKVKVVYMAHGFHFYKGSSKKNWLVYYTIEKLFAKHTDTLITINSEDFELAKKKLNVKDIRYVHGVGVDTSRLNCDENKQTLRNELGLLEKDFILLMVGELNQNKNQIVVLKALAQLENKNIKLLIAGNGPNRQFLHEQVKLLNLENRVQFLGYTRQIGRYYKLSDVFVLSSMREGLPCAVMEAMVSGLPIICSNIRGCRDLVEEEKGGYLCAPQSATEFKNAINKAYKHGVEGMGEFNKQKIIPFTAQNVLLEIEQILEN